jgi:hypothetical protein
MKARIFSICLILVETACFAQDKAVTGEKPVWAVTHFRTTQKFQPFEIDDISQGPEHLVGSGTLSRENKGIGQLAIQGHLNKLGELVANVSLAVSDREDGNWKVIESSLSDKVDATLTAAPHVNQLYLRIHFDAFQPYIGKFKFCQVRLQTGETDVFPMTWLTEKGE